MSRISFLLPAILCTLLCLPGLAEPLPLGGYMLFDGEKATEVGDGIKLKKKKGYRYARFKKKGKVATRLVEDWAYTYEHENVVLEFEFIDDGTSTITPRLGVVVDGALKWHTPVKQSNEKLFDSGKKRRAIFRFEDMPAGVDGAKVHLEVAGVEWVHRVRMLHDQPSRVWSQFERYDALAKGSADDQESTH